MAARPVIRHSVAQASTFCPGIPPDRGIVPGSPHVRGADAMLAWEGRCFGWDDPERRVQLALVTSFILGIVGGYKAKG